ncbi:MAG: PfkB family carbohydrate kinase [Verrucomicrobiota bacterium]|nr:PfkB family carbohydrate kinase [Verrucomicrobiota bacterium]
MNDESIIGKINNFKNLKVGVIGDIILDEYIWGECTRISQEAPVPVVKVDKRTVTMGGAANVISNLTSLGASAFAYGIVGNDDNAGKLKNLLNNLKCNIQGIIVDPSRPTTVKTRVIASRQQVVRIDDEIVEKLKNDDKEELKERVIKDIKNQEIDALIFEDYAKGCLDHEIVSEITQYAKEYEIPTALDPHPGHPLNVHNITLITPNRAEAFALAGKYLKKGCHSIEEDKPLMDVKNILFKKWSPEILLITLGEHGMGCFLRNGHKFHIPTVAQDVFDVSGAGDTVIATFLLAYLAKSSPQEAARIANTAAGIVVGHVGTQPVSAEDLKKHL